MALADPSTLGFEAVGDDTQIFELARISDPEKVSLGSHVVIDDFVFVQGGQGVELGSYVHVASFSSLTGVTSDLEPWTANVGTPTRVVKERPCEKILRYAEELGLA